MNRSSWQALPQLLGEQSTFAPSQSMRNITDGWSACLKDGTAWRTGWSQRSLVAVRVVADVSFPAGSVSHEEAAVQLCAHHPLLSVSSASWLQLRFSAKTATANAQQERRLWAGTREIHFTSERLPPAARQPIRMQLCGITMPDRHALCATKLRLREYATIRTGLDALVAVLHEEVPHPSLRLPVAVLQGGRKHLCRDAQLAVRCRRRVSLRSRRGDQDIRRRSQHCVRWVNKVWTHTDAQGMAQHVHVCREPHT